MPVLFVYGTLRLPTGGPASDTHYHHRIADAISMAESATLYGAAIYDLGNYPGIGPADPTSGVRGDAIEISDEALIITDEIEGHPGFYERRENDVVLDNGTGGPAWVYWTPPHLLESVVPIASGDWFDRPRGDANGTIEEQLAREKSPNAGDAMTD